MTDVEFNKKLYEVLSTDGVLNIKTNISSYQYSDGEINVSHDTILEIRIPNQPIIRIFDQS